MAALQAMRRPRLGEEVVTLERIAGCEHYLRACGHYCCHTFCCYCRLIGPPLEHAPCPQCARIDGGVS